MTKLPRFLFCLLCIGMRLCAADYSIAFVHIGPTLPSYVPLALKQARLFNPECSIFLLANTSATEPYDKELYECKIQTVPYESLQKSPEHRFYKQLSSRPGFWNHTLERFFYLYDFMQDQKIEHLFHLENDNMLYVDLATLWPIFEKQYPGLAVTFDNEDRGIAGFMYIGGLAAMRQFVQFAARDAHSNRNDMQLLGLFKSVKKSQFIDNLPIIMEEYTHMHPMISSCGLATKKPSAYHRHVNLFQSLFDAAAVGQYLGGIDPRHPDSAPGFINERCLFNPSFLQFIWHVDEEGRSVPYASLDGREYRMNNLHIHSKRLHEFASK